MCGIAGIAVGSGEERPSEQVVRAMCDALVHRGPDEEGILVDGAVALGMHRLAIIDVQEGHQPLYNEDQTVRAVFNGVSSPQATY